tara:strand:+ start:135 stop:578 length:444 start_codon:yes stop_codon:yes gene_type:complete
MKIKLSHTDPNTPSHVWVNDIERLDTIVGDNEATEIIVDSFLSAFNFEALSYVLNKIVSKMRLNSTLVIYQKDIDLLAHRYSRTGMALSDINTILFEDCPSIGCVLNTEAITDILLQNKLKIQQKTLDTETMQSIIISRRIANAGVN